MSDIYQHTRNKSCLRNDNKIFELFEIYLHIPIQDIQCNFYDIEFPVFRLTLSKNIQLNKLVNYYTCDILVN